MRLLNVDYRARQLSFRRKQISEWMESERTLLQEEIKVDKQLEETYIASRLAAIEQEATRQEKDAIAMYGMLEGSDPNVAPLRRALAVWGLTADDIGVLSIHGTSTVANVSCPVPA
jgi:fatty acid synthase subunit alpha, fungi type